ncbi:uncharacterized protein LOC8288865 [Ricinus communis]|uniref:Uncharacterized protein n=1 Tax=Ricinus communis TaxID=3988 RepID=B9RYW3_RICCO|nr:uncharacterized protein LOC8288865 [Ricinus communis]EEF43465.1 conserved hypothetical protein [Ricinus communis]|eukprot:XP_002518932.1 uncharacterized protein LOC8288865 [Ricinus communis]
MKGTCTLVASVLAASTVAFSAGDSDVAFHPSSNQGSSSSVMGKLGASNACAPSSDKEKFAPRFDGLRFIETLITAHR